MTSKRLPGKSLRVMVDKPMIRWVYDRVSRASSIRQCVVATSTDQSDDIIYEYCESEEIACFRGSLDNVLGAVLEVCGGYGAGMCED